MRGELHGKLGVRQTEGVQEETQRGGCVELPENNKISHIFTVDTLLGPAAWSL